MQKLNKQDYEAIAAYDYQQNSVYKATLIIEPSACTVALCIYDSKGSPQVQNIWRNDNQVSCEESMQDKLDWKSCRDAIKDAVRRFHLTNQLVDSTIPGCDRKASDIINMFHDLAGNTLNFYFQAVDAVLRDANINNQELRILLVGPFAGFFPAEAAVRLHYSPAMPMMPDVRYGYYEELSPVVREGLEIIQRNAVKGIIGPVEWKVQQFDGVNGIRESYIMLAADGTSLDDLVELKLTEAVFASGDDELVLVMPGAERRIPVPNILMRQNIGRVRLGLQYDGNGFTLIVDVDGRRETYPVDIKIKGE